MPAATDSLAAMAAMARNHALCMWLMRSNAECIQSQIFDCRMPTWRRRAPGWRRRRREVIAGRGRGCWRGRRPCSRRRRRSVSCAGRRSACWAVRRNRPAGAFWRHRPPRAGRLCACSFWHRHAWAAAVSVTVRCWGWGAEGLAGGRAGLRGAGGCRGVRRGGRRLRRGGRGRADMRTWRRVVWGRGWLVRRGKISRAGGTWGRAVAAAVTVRCTCFRQRGLACKVRSKAHEGLLRRWSFSRAQEDTLRVKGQRGGEKGHWSAHGQGHAPT